MKSDTLEAAIAPDLGGKVASLRARGVELLQAPLRSPEPRTHEMGFEAGDASGWDECLPTVSACRVETAFGDANLPDHGDIWRLPHECTQVSEREVRLATTCFSLPLRLERTLMLSDTALRTDYRLENTGKTDTPYAWCAHPLFTVEAGDIVTLPPSVTQVVVEGSNESRLGTKGRVLTWPIAELASGVRVDLSQAEGPDRGIGDKLYTASPAEEWASIERRRAGLRVRVQFDPSLAPWLGLWLCYGGWPPGQANRQQCVALEPCTAPADSLAEAQRGGWARTLAPGQSAHWWMNVAIEEISVSQQ